MENFFWMIAGALISMWTGAYITKLYSFRALRTRAKEALVDSFSDENLLNFREDSNAVYRKLLPVSIALRSEGHGKAANQLMRIERMMRSALEKAHKEAAHSMINGGGDKAFLLLAFDALHCEGPDLLGMIDKLAPNRSMLLMWDF